MPTALAVLEVLRIILSSFAGSIEGILAWVKDSIAPTSSCIGASGCPISPNISFMAETAFDISLSRPDILSASISRIFVSTSGKAVASATVIFISFAIFCIASDLGLAPPIKPRLCISSYRAPASPALNPPICEISLPGPYKFSNTLVVMAEVDSGVSPRLPVKGSVAYLPPIYIF